MEQEPRTQETVEGLFRVLWVEVGGNPSDLAPTRPNDGGWPNALSYDVVRKDGQSVRVRRPLLDDKGRTHEIKAKLEELLETPWSQIDGD